MHTSDPSETKDPAASSPFGAEPDKKERHPLGVVLSLLFRGGIIVVVLAVAIAIAALLMATKKQPAHTEGAVDRLVVRAIEANPERVRRTWEGYGTAESMIAADIVAEVAGMVIDRPERAEPGERVDRGSVLLALETTDTANALRAAKEAAGAIEAQLDGLAVESDRVATQVGYAREEIETQERELERIDRAIEAGAGNDSQRDAALAALRRLQRETESLQQQLDLIPSRRAQLRAQLAAQNATAQTAQRDLDRSTIRSPLAGVIQSIDPRPGDWVQRGTVVARVVDLSKLEIPVRLPAGAISWVRKGDPVELWPDGEGSSDQRRGVITRIAPEADPMNRTITVYVELDQDPESSDRVASGRFVLARVQPADPTPRIVVPRRTVNDGLVVVLAPTDKPGIYRIESRKVDVGYSLQQELEQLDPDEDQWTVIRSGVRDGDLIAVSLLDQLVEGMEVEMLGDDRAAPAETQTETETEPGDAP